MTQTKATPYTTMNITYVAIFLKLVRNEDKTSSPSVVVITLLKSKIDRKITKIHMKISALMIFRIKR